MQSPFVALAQTKPKSGCQILHSAQARRYARRPSSAVMRLEHEGVAFNLLDTPGHQISAHWDFSEDTYRTLTVSTAR